MKNAWKKNKNMKIKVMNTTFANCICGALHAFINWWRAIRQVSAPTQVTPHGFSFSLYGSPNHLPIWPNDFRSGQTGRDPALQTPPKLPKRLEIPMIWAPLASPRLDLEGFVQISGRLYRSLASCSDLWRFRLPPPMSSSSACLGRGRSVCELAILRASGISLHDLCYFMIWVTLSRSEKLGSCRTQIMESSKCDSS